MPVHATPNSRPLVLTCDSHTVLVHSAGFIKAPLQAEKPAQAYIGSRVCGVQLEAPIYCSLSLLVASHPITEALHPEGVLPQELGTILQKSCTSQQPYRAVRALKAVTLVTA